MTESHRERSSGNVVVVTREVMVVDVTREVVCNDNRALEALIRVTRANSRVDELTHKKVVFWTQRHAFVLLCEAETMHTHCV
jgi:hypothetical protein